MARRMRDTLRKVRAGTSRAMKRLVRHCAECRRGQVPARYDRGDGTRGWQCRYCKHGH